MRAGNKTNKKNILAGDVTSCYFQVHCAVASIIGQGFSPPQRPALAADPASENNIHSLQPQRRIYYQLPHSSLPLCLHPAPLLLSPSQPSVSPFFIFNPVDVLHAWRSLGRNTDMVNQRGRGRARLRESPSHPRKKMNMSPVTLPPGSAAAAQKSRRQRVGKTQSASCWSHVFLPASLCPVLLPESATRPLVCLSREEKSYISTLHHSAVRPRHLVQRDVPGVTHADFRP